MLKHDPPLLVERKSAELDKAVAAFFAKARAADEVFSLRDICRAITRSDDFGESYRRAVERAFRKSPPERERESNNPIRTLER